MLRLCTLTSGSSGNAVLIDADGTKILIDCGITGKTAADRLCSVGVDPAELSAVLVTHEHADHIKGVGVLSRRFDLPVYASIGTWSAMIGQIGAVPDKHIHYIQADVPFSVGNAVVFPFATPHDAAESLGFTVSDGKKTASVATDLGQVDRYIYDNIKGSDLMVLEANHDERTLINGPYPYPLKQRILSDRGHLSNRVCGALCARLLSEGGPCRQILLGHLSKENNTPQMAFGSVKASVELAGGKVGADMRLGVAGRFEPSPFLEA